MGELQIQQITADTELAGLLTLEVGTDLTRVARIIYTENRPIAYLLDTLPMDILSVGRAAEPVSPDRCWTCYCSGESRN